MRVVGEDLKRREWIAISHRADQHACEPGVEWPANVCTGTGSFAATVQSFTKTYIIIFALAFKS
jgi:hypothetical protein